MMLVWPPVLRQVHTGISYVFLQSTHPKTDSSLINYQVTHHAYHVARYQLLPPISVYHVLKLGVREINASVSLVPHAQYSVVLAPSGAALTFGPRSKSGEAR